MGKQIYLLIFYIQIFLSKIIFKFHFSCSARNSIYQKYFSFLKSDLDISIFIKHLKMLGPKSKQLNAYFKISPIIKEINFYYLPNEQVSLINYYESLRDPALNSFNKSPSLFNKEEKFVFLLRMYHSNFHKLEKFDHRTKNKWQFYLELCHIKENFNNKNELLLLIVKNTINIRNNEIALCIQNFLEKLNENKSYENAYLSASNPMLLSAIFPHCFYFLDLSFDNIDEDLKKVTCCQLSWELWGLSTQVHLLSNNLEYIKKYKNCQTFINRIKFDQPDYNQLLDSLKINSQKIIEATINQ